MASSSSAGCAVGPDGQLLDEEHMDWYDSDGDKEPTKKAALKRNPPSPSPKGPINAKRQRQLTDRARASAQYGSEDKQAGQSSRNIAAFFGTKDVTTTAQGKSALRASGKKPNGSKKAPGKAGSSKGKAPEVVSLNGSDAGDAVASGDELDAYERTRNPDAHFTVTKKHHDRNADPRTEDLRSFYEVTGTDPQTGKTQYRCCVCKVIYTGNTTSQRTHIRRSYPTHGAKYKQICESLGIAMHPRCLPADDTDDEDGAKQTQLELFSEGPVSSWSSEGLREWILMLIIVEHLSIRIVDSKTFRGLLKFQRPKTRENEIPHRTKLTEFLMEKAQLASVKLREIFKTIPGEISFTFDGWTSLAGIPYLTFTVHYIEADSQDACKWTLRARILGFPEVRGSHSGANTAATLMRVIDKYELRSKLGHGTSDNVTTNDTCMRRMESSLDGVDGHQWCARERRVNCGEHVVHLGAKDFIIAVNPSAPQAKKRGLPATAAVDDVDGVDGDGNEEEELEMDSDWTLQGLESALDDEDLDAMADFEPGDVLGKALALIKQIRASPQAIAFLHKQCKNEGLDVLELLNWIRTRWGSMNCLLRRFLYLRRAVNLFCRLADTSDEVPDLKDKNYFDYCLSDDEWHLLELVYAALEPVRKAQGAFSSETHPTVWKIMPVLDRYLDEWTAMRADKKFELVYHAIDAGIAKVKKWLTKIRKSGVAFICLALHPKYKFEYAKKKLSKRDFKAGMKIFESVFDRYATELASEDASATQSQSGGNTAHASNAPALDNTTYDDPDDYMMSVISQRLDAERRAPSDPRAELTTYAEEPLVLGKESPIAWWGKQQHRRILSRMARDYLAIQGSSVSSERAFSQGGLTSTARRNALDPETFEAIQILRDAYRTGLIDAQSEAILHDLREAEIALLRNSDVNSASAMPIG